MAGSGDNAAPIIIKRVKKGGHHAHHGGAWKVAYADFVTAMMAFFLLLWLLNATTDEQKAGIADYFTPTSVSRSNSGGGGVLGGQSISSEGAMQSNRSAVNLTISLPSTDTPDELGDYRRPGGGPDTEIEEAPTQSASDAEKLLDEQAADQVMARREEEQFKEAEEVLRQAIESVPELKQLAENLLIDHTPEGLRIQLVDRDRLSMFPRGSAEMHDHTRKLLGLVVSAIDQMPNRIAIKGHTDATPFASQNGYSNWELSTDRANASRRALEQAGLPAARIDSVAGRAAEEPLFPDDPTSPRNRRISIILLREANKAGGEAGDGQTASDLSSAPRGAQSSMPASDGTVDVQIEMPAN
ncbi:MAG: flagellar motor protein MotB [Kiloniellales bacterium]